MSLRGQTYACVHYILALASTLNFTAHYAFYASEKGKVAVFDVYSTPYRRSCLCRGLSCISLKSTETFTYRLNFHKCILIKFYFFFNWIYIGKDCHVHFQLLTKNVFGFEHTQAARTNFFVVILYREI